MENKLILTIFIPTFRRPDLLEKAILSALDQKTSISYEIIVIDNDSTSEWSNLVDNLIIKINSPKVKLFRNKTNLGMVGNWNECINKCKSKWMTILNDDDILRPTFINKVFNVIERKPHFGMYVSRNDTLIDNRDLLKNYSQTRSKIRSFVLKFIALFIDGKALSVKDYIQKNKTGNSLCAIFRSEYATEIGGFDINYYPCFDYKFNVEMCKRYGVFYLYDILGSWRVSVNETFNSETWQAFKRMDILIQQEITDYLNNGTK